jgi:chaperonin GroEL (HSP60 family)
VQHKNNPDKKGANFGIDVYSGKIADLMQKRVIEPLKIKKQAIASATEVVETILRIDDIIAASGSSKEPGPRSPGDFESED